MNKLSEIEAEITIKNSLLKQEGNLKFQFVLVDSNAIFKSEIFGLRVLKAINAAESIEDEYPTIFNRLEELEVKVNNMQFDTFNYTNLQNKPQINEIELNGNKTLEELGIIELTNSEIESLIEKE